VRTITDVTGWRKLRFGAQLFRVGIVGFLMMSVSGCSDVGGASPSPNDAPSHSTALKIQWNQASAHLGEFATVCGPVAGMRQTDNAFFMNLGVDFPNEHRFTVVVWDQVGSAQNSFRDSDICVTGNITSFRRLPQITAPL
jgi:hypothetical protein